MVTYRQPFSGEYPITQKYGEIIPGVTFQNKPHTGIDYGCPATTPILASAAGEIMLAEYDDSGYGRTVIIQHPDGKATLYAHLALIPSGIVPGAAVMQGQCIGYAGVTGNATGPHLHFEAREKWCDFRSHRDPVTFLPMMTVDDSITSQNLAAGTGTISAGTSQKDAQTSQKLKGADVFASGELLKVVCTNGVKAFFDPGFSYERMTVYPQGTPFYYTGDQVVRKDNGLTYLRVVPAGFSVWVAVHDEDTQILDTEK